MLKLFAAALLAASALAVDDYCCELYHDANYGGVMQEVCPNTNIHGDMKVTPKSFKDIVSDGKMSSYKCGVKVHAQMCPEAFKSTFSRITWTQEYQCQANIGAEGIFATDINNANGNLESASLGINEDNFLSSIILGQCVGAQCGVIPPKCPAPQTVQNGVCTCPGGSLPDPVSGKCGAVGGGKGWACNMLDCDETTGLCLRIPTGGVSDTTDFFSGHGQGDLIKSIKMDPNMTVEYFQSTGFSGNSHNVANQSSIKTCVQVENGAQKTHHDVQSIKSF